MSVKDIIAYIKLPFRKEKELFYSLHSILGFYPGNIEYYKLALLHKSIAKKNEKGRPLNNERLEFLGDAILDAVVGDIVYKHFEGKREGFLTVTRSKLVSRETLGKLAEEMGLNQLLLSSGSPTSHNNYMGGNAFEALVGAIYLDRGYRAAKKFMERKICNNLINIDNIASKEINFKSKLQEWAQKYKYKVEYVELNFKREKGGSPIFTYQIMIEGMEAGTGKGYSKKESQQIAAKETLKRIKANKKFVDEIFKAKRARKGRAIDDDPVKVYSENESAVDNIVKEKAAEGQTKNPPAKETDEFDFDNVEVGSTNRELSHDEIIAAAEAEAFK